MGLGHHDVGDVEAGQRQVGTLGLQGDVGGVVGTGEEVGAAGAQAPRRERQDPVQLLEVAATVGLEGLAHRHAVQGELGVLVVVERPRAVVGDTPDEVGGALDGVADDSDVEHANLALVCCLDPPGRPVTGP
jgi:hypothetical protein